MFTPTTENCDNYLGSRTGNYEWRAIRYRHAIDAMIASTHSLTDDMTIFDVGAGWTELDYCLRTEYGWKGRYIPVDGGIDNTDLDHWTPPRRADWFVCLEILEHLYKPYEAVARMGNMAEGGVVFSTPNPRTTDVFEMDETHVIEVDPQKMRQLGYRVTEEMFYGGKYSNGMVDSLFGIWTRRK